MGLFDAFNMLDPTSGDPLAQLTNALGSAFGGDTGADNANWAADAVASSPPEVQRAMGAGTGGNGGATGAGVRIDSSGMSIGTYNLGGPDGAGPGAAAAAAAGARGVRSALLHAASVNAGFRVTTKKLKALLKKLGQAALLTLIRITAEQLLYLLSTAPKRGSRGPFMRTVVKRVRRGRAAEHQLTKYSRRAGIHHHSGAKPRKGK